MLLVRTIFHALLLLTMLVIVDALTTRIAGVQLVLGLVRTGHFCLFSIAAAAALNRQRLLLPVLLLVSFLVLYPLTLDLLVRLLVTTTLAILFGTALSGVIQEGTPHAPTATRPDPQRRPPGDLHQ